MASVREKLQEKLEESERKIAENDLKAIRDRFYTFLYAAGMSRDAESYIKAIDSRDALYPEAQDHLIACVMHEANVAALYGLEQFRLIARMVADEIATRQKGESDNG